MRRHPGLHIYHFAPYEPGALKRLMGRYASREEEIDRMLRSKLFVDLFAVVWHVGFNVAFRKWFTGIYRKRLLRLPPQRPMR
jgi:hypothetical protein